MEAENDDIEHVRLLARRWAVQRLAGTNDTALTDNEVEDLLGSVHREMVREVERRKYESQAWADARRLTIEAGEPWVLGEHLDPHVRETLAHHIALTLGEPFVEDSLAVHMRTLAGRTEGERSLAWRLCEAAGWPGEAV